MRFLTFFVAALIVLLLVNEALKPVLPTTYQPGQTCALGSTYVTILLTSRNLTGQELYKVYNGSHTLWANKDALKECK